MLGNLRLTTQHGFGFRSGQFSSIGDWESIYNATTKPSGDDHSPHYVAYIWSVYLWAYEVSGYQPLLDRSRTALGDMMNSYPSAWVPTSNGIAMQRARIVLPLAWLVRVDDTPQHRSWLKTAVEGLLTRQVCGPDGSGWCALTEELSHEGWARGTRVPNNDDYGTFEAPLNQENSDPVSDLLYTSNFALLGLHEAAGATGDPQYIAAADALADFMVRVQAKSSEHATLDGAFFRAFDHEKWEVWASDADIGWGAFSVETGWTQSWISACLGMRVLNTTLWDLAADPWMVQSIKPDFDVWVPTMFGGVEPDAEAA